MKQLLWIGCLAVIGLTGCGRFFISQNSASGGGTTNTAAGDVLYVADANTTTGYYAISAYTVSTSGTLTQVSGSPYTLSSPPLSMAITPGNTFLYVGLASGIIGYSIGTGGVLTQLNSGTALVSDVQAPTAMAVDSGGTTLLAAGIDLASGSNEFQMGGYGINTTTGALTAGSGFPLSFDTANTSTTSTPTQVYFTPNDSLVYVTLGNGGTSVFTYTAPGGLAEQTAEHINLSASGSSQNAVIANNASTQLFLTETGTGVHVYNIGTSGAVTEISGSPFAAGTGPEGLVLDAAGTDLYVADKGGNGITGFSVAATGTVGALTALGSSPFAAGTNAMSLTLDQSRNFLAVANPGGTPDLGVYSFDTTTAGKLDSTATETSTTTPLGSNLVIATHPTT